MNACLRLSAITESHTPSTHGKISVGGYRKSVLLTSSSYSDFCVCNSTILIQTLGSCTLSLFLLPCSSFSFLSLLNFIFLPNSQTLFVEIQFPPDHVISKIYYTHVFCFMSHKLQRGDDTNIEKSHDCELLTYSSL